MSAGEGKKSALVPKLRFPEFREAEGWTCGQLDSALSSISNGLVLEQSSDTSGVKVTRIETISAGTIDLDKVGLVKTFQDISGYKLRVGDILLSNINSVAHIGKSVFVDRDYDVYHGMNLLRLAVNRAKHSPQFIYYLINTDNIRASLRERANKAVNQASINQTELGKTEVALPPKPEQQKIADCLSSLDELITAQGRKVEALKTYKRGLMQQLFPRERETLSRVRFPEFRDAGEWTVKKLEEIGRVIRGASPRPKGDPRYYGGPVPRLMVQDVTRDGKWVTPQIDSLTEEGARLSRPCPAGTLTIVCSGVVGVVSFLAVDACIHDGFLALVDIDESLASKDFLFHRLSTLREQFERGATHGGVFTNLTTTGVDQLEIAFPSPDEQQRIADCLGSLDDRITAATQELETLKTHKKGLMQQLFPSLVEA